MNQIVLSAVFLQQALSFSPQERIFRPEISVEKTLAERNRDFFRQLAKPRIKKNLSAEKVKTRAKFSRDFSPFSRKLNKKNEQKKVLIIAPHPDDEILSAANLIQQKLKSREKIKIVYLTNGDALDPDDKFRSQAYGFQRIKESQHATRRLGVKKSDLFFLGFPDAYSDQLPPFESIKSRFTGRDKTYRTSYFPNLKYSRESLRQALQKIIDQIQPDEIYFPAKNDNNVDHAVVQEILPPNPAKKFVYNIHRTYCENEICECNQPVDEKKLELIKTFQSQRFSPHHEEFLDQFACQKEVFQEIE